MSSPRPTAAAERHASRRFELGHFVAGRVVPGTSGRQGPVHDPATGA